MKISRRNFLKGSLTTLFVAGFNLPIYALNNIKKNLVVISLRGGMDGLFSPKNILLENKNCCS